MKFIECLTDFPSEYEIELKDTFEVDIIKEALNNLYHNLAAINKPTKKEIKKIKILEEMCKEINKK
jgi:hypothetical protein